MSQAGPLRAFFNRYPHFDYDPTKAATAEFQRLCCRMHWMRDDPDQVEAWQSFRDALVMQFNENYGTDENDLTSWQTMCATLGIDPIPAKLDEARKAVLETHVNLVDLTEGFKAGRRVTIFPTEAALSEYTVETKKFFPSSNLKAGSLLRALLRHILNPPSASTQCNESGRVVFVPGKGGARGGKRRV